MFAALFMPQLKVSTLEISLVLELNQGLYTCQSQNKAGTATGNFTITVTKHRLSAPGAASSSSGEQQASIVTASQTERGDAANDGHSGSEHENVTPRRDSEVIAGLVLGILFGAFLVLIVFGVTVIIVCRRRHGRAFGGTDRVAAESELEKLTPATLVSSMSSRETVALINPVQKPPRLGFAGSATTPTGECGAAVAR